MQSGTRLNDARVPVAWVFEHDQSLILLTRILFYLLGWDIDSFCILKPNSVGFTRESHDESYAMEDLSSVLNLPWITFVLV